MEREGECRREPKKPLLFDAPGVDTWVGEDAAEAVSAPDEAGGMLREKEVVAVATSVEVEREQTGW